MRNLWLLAALAGAAHAETWSLTLKQAVDRSLSQSPDAVIARMDQLKAAAGVRIAKDPFTPHLGIGSGAAYSSGFPLSIEGSAPAAVQAKLTESIFNKPLSLAVSQAKESARGATYAAGQRTDEIVFRVVSLYLDVARAGQLAEAAGRQVDSLTRVAETVATRVEAGRELPVARQETIVNKMRAQQRIRALQADQEYGERSLAVALGYAPTDLVKPVAGERNTPPIPDNEQAAIETALANSKELRRLESNYQVSSLEVKA
ncbi:MAG TPA: TolC family protein, partial [Bryobacteraceae bacterium]|nr:TolC family protein [Bryobacteraceae bacterium]